MSINAEQQIKDFPCFPRQLSLEWLQAQELLRRQYYVVWRPKYGPTSCLEQRPSLLRRILRCIGLWIPYVCTYIPRPISKDRAIALITNDLAHSTTLEAKTFRIFLSVLYMVRIPNRPRLDTPHRQ